MRHTKRVTFFVIRLCCQHLQVPYMIHLSLSFASRIIVSVVAVFSIISYSLKFILTTFNMNWCRHAITKVTPHMYTYDCIVRTIKDYVFDFRITSSEISLSRRFPIRCRLQTKRIDSAMLFFLFFHFSVRKWVFVIYECKNSDEAKFRMRTQTANCYIMRTFPSNDGKNQLLFGCLIYK